MDDLDRFTSGDCHVLAVALADMTGWPLYCFRSENYDADVHAFVVMPDGRALDIEGTHKLSRILAKWAKWGAIEAVPHNPEYVMNLWCGEQFSGSRERAKIVAQELIEQYGAGQQMALADSGSLR